MEIPAYVSLISTAIFAIVGIVGFGWIKILKETNELLKAQNEELRVANRELDLQHDVNSKAIASLQGQIDVLKSIPLVNIDATLKQLAQFNESLARTNKKILDRLNNDAIILAKDTRAAAVKVAEVKSELKHPSQGVE